MRFLLSPLRLRRRPPSKCEEVVDLRDGAASVTRSQKGIFPWAHDQGQVKCPKCGEQMTEVAYKLYKHI